MALDDYLESEVAVAVAATAAVLSPQVRNVLRRGAVYGLAGVLVAGDAITSFARGVGRGVQNVGAAATTAATTAAATATQAATTATQGTGTGAGVATEQHVTGPDSAADLLAAEDEASERQRRTRRPRVVQPDEASSQETPANE